MQIHRIGMIGSRKLPSKECWYFSKLAYALVKNGFEIVSGGCPTGADNAAATGADAADQGESLTLWLDNDKHSFVTYPPKASKIFIEVDAHTDLWELAKRHADAGQWQPKYRGYFVRDAHIAKDSDVILAWRSGESRGTNHTVKCAQELGKPVLLVDLAYKGAPWSTPEELINRVLARIQRFQAEGN